MAQTSRVDFSYAFATPHRVTTGMPDSSDRTLLDLQAGSLRMAWTYDDLTHYALGAFRTPPTMWSIQVTPEIDGKAPASSKWTRVGGWLPSVKNSYDDPRGTIVLRVTSSKAATIARVTITNTDKAPHRFTIKLDSASWGENPAWVQPGRWVGDNLVAGWNARADRVLVMGVGADAYSLAADGKAPGPHSMIMVWDVPAGKTREAWIVRPYHAYRADLPALRKCDWAAEAAEGRTVWEKLIGRASKIEVPDPGVANAFRACLADLFIMREPAAGGLIVPEPGTEAYRAPGTVEGGISCIALDELGLHREAARAYKWCLAMQEPDGNWDDARGWGHLMWGIAGFKAWTAMEHYQLTGDRAYLEAVYPRMLANSRWQDEERARTRVKVKPGEEKPLGWGLMPRGMGDCGLMDDGDLYGVFLPHNIWAVYADKVAVQAAEILGKTEDLRELRRIYERGRRDLLVALERGAIEENGYRWIPAVPGKICGSRWGALNVLFPCHLLGPDNALVVGTLRKIESHLSPGGIPVHTGWLKDGMWVAITLDNVAEAHLVRAAAGSPGDADVAARYLYATLNHGTPLYTWCEERGQEKNTTTCTGDRQHLWTPVAVVRYLRDSLVMEDGDGLHLALGTDREWLGCGGPIGISKASTHFGDMSYELRYDAAASKVTATITAPKRVPPAWIKVHVRLPGGLKIVSVKAKGETKIDPGGEAFVWVKPEGRLKAEVTVAK